MMMICGLYWRSNGSSVAHTPEVWATEEPFDLQYNLFGLSIDLQPKLLRISVMSLINSREMKQNFIVIDVFDWDMASSDDFLYVE
jgi:hypothetical protein